MSTQNKPNKETYIFGGLWLLFMAAASAFFFIFQTHHAADYDSTYQYFLCRHSWKDMYDLLLQDYSPPLYAIALKAYSVVFGTDLNVLRSANLILTAYLFFVTLFPLRRLTGAKCSILSSVLILCSQYNYYFGHVIRPAYPGYILTTAVFVYAALSFFDRKTKDLVTFSIVAILSMYTHNVSLISAFCVYAILCIASFLIKDKEMLKKYFISGIIVAVLYAPWLFVTIRQLNTANNNFWNLKMKVAETMDFVYSYPFYFRSNVIVNLLISLFVLMACLISPILIFDRKKLKKVQTFTELDKVFKSDELRERLKKIGLIGFFQVVSLLVFYAFSYKLNIQTPRYFYVLTGGALIFIAGLMSIGDKKHIVTAVALIVMPVNMVSNYMYFDKTNNESEITRLYADISAHNENGDTLYLYHGDETSLGVDSYLFPEAVQMIDRNTYTVLLTYDVFTSDIRYIDDGKDPFDMSDEVFVITYGQFFFPMDPSAYTYEEIGVYKIPYVGTETGNIDVHAYRVTPA